MKVLQIHWWGDAANVTGSVEKVIDSFSLMEEEDIDLSFASLSESPTYRRNGKLFHSFCESQWRNRLFNKILSLNAFTFPSLVKLVEELHPDILHIHNRQSLVDPLMQRLSWRPKVLCHYHRRFGRFVVPKSADMLLTVSEAIRKELQKETQTDTPTRVIYNPVPCVLFPFKINPRSANKIKILYAGGRQKHKGFEEFTHAISEFSERADLEFTICGPKLSEYNSPSTNARVLGLLEHQAFQAELKACDIVLMPSHFEGFSILALEAMSQGKLLVATQGGGLAEIVSSDCAIVIEVGSTQSLVNGLTRAFNLMKQNHEGKLSAVLSNAQNRCRQYSPQKTNATLADIYRSIPASR